ncbi:MAG: hypothetical protein IPF83_02500 [Rhodanobacteraceae bacterium]|nr:hypothetical protein [Rhodanobacteraceae bacterium]
MLLRTITSTVLILAATATQAYDIRRISAVENPLILGTQGNADASRCVINDDASLIGFLSGATNLIVGDQNGKIDAFLDIGNGVTRLSRGGTGAESPMGAASLAVSADGQFVVFRLEFDVDVAISNDWDDIYRLNRNNGALLKVADSAQLAFGYEPQLAISDDGRFVAYTALDLGDNHVFRFDAQTTTTVQVDVDLGVAGQFGDAERIAMDATGNLIAFDSDEADLVASDSNGVRDVFVRDINAGTTTRVSKRSNGAQANDSSELSDLSDDGTYVLFSSLATNLDNTVPDVNGKRDLFRHNLGNGNTRRASLDENGAEFAYDTIDGGLSGDGQFVWLISYRNNNRPQLWRKNMATDAMLQVTSGNSAVSQVNVDLAGTNACFIDSKVAVDLSANDLNGRDDVYRATISPGQIVTIAREGEAATPIPAAVLADANIRLLGIDDAGDTTVVAARPPQLDSETFPNLAPSNNFHAYLIDTASNAVDSPCRNANGDHTNGSCDVAALSGDGRYVFFVSDGINIHPDSTVNRAELYRRDRQTGAVTFISRNTLGGVPDSGVDRLLSLAVSSNGNRVVFKSFATDLVSGDTNALSDLFLWDAVTGVRRISQHNNGTQANDLPYDRPYISGDGRYVVFAHEASNLVDGDSNGTVDLFLYDALLSTLERIAQPGVETTAVSRVLDFDRNGEWLGFFSAAVEYDGNDPGDSNLFRWQRSTGQVTPIATGLQAGEQFTQPVALLRDGTGVYFGIDTDPLPTIASIVLHRQFFASGAPQPILTIPTQADDVQRYKVESMFVADDLSAYVAYNWPLNVIDNNRLDDIGKLLSGYGVAEFGTATVDVPENAGTVNFSVFRREGQAYDASVYAVPANGTAINGSDFNAAPTGLFASWLDGTSGAFPSSFSIVDDSLTEPTETFTLILSNYSVVGPGAITTLTVHIIDNDGPLFLDGFE